MSAPWLLEGSIVVVLISRPLLALHALLVDPPLVLDRDGSVDEVAKGLVLTPLQSLAKVVVKATQEPDLLLLVGIGVVGGVPHHLHEVALVLLDPLRTLSHGAELLHLLDQQLAGQVLLAECLAELQPSDERWVRVGGSVVVPPSLVRTLQLVHGDGNTLRVRADGEVVLGLDHPQPVISVERIIRVAEVGGLQADEPLDLLREVLVLRSGVVPTVAAVLHGLCHPLHQLSLDRHHIHQVRWGWWRLVRLRPVLLLILLGFSILSFSF
jgi:hypothetical protein